MNSDIEYDAESRGQSSPLETNLVKRLNSNVAVGNVACVTLSEIVKDDDVSYFLKSSIPAAEIELRYDIQLEGISKALGIDTVDTKLGKLQAVLLLQSMSLKDIENIKNRILRDIIYAAKASNIEINHAQLNRGHSSDHEGVKQLDPDFLIDRAEAGVAAIKQYKESKSEHIGEVFQLSDQVQNLQTSLEIVSATLGVTLTAADLSKGFSHYRKLHKMNRELKAIDKNLDAINNEFKRLEKRKNQALPHVDYKKLTIKAQLKKKELELNKRAIINAKKILKNKLNEVLTDAVFAGTSGAASLAGVVLSELGGQAAKHTGEIALGSILGAVHVVEGGLGVIEDINDFDKLHAEKDQLKSIKCSNLNKKVGQVFNFIIKLKMDNLKHYQKQQIYLHLTDDVLNIVQGAAAIAGEAGAVGAQGVAAGVAGTRGVLQLGNYVINHQSDIKDLIHLKKPPVVKRTQVAYKLASLIKDVRENTLYLQGEMQERSLMAEMGREAIQENIESFKLIEALKPKWTNLDASVTARLMIDRASSKLKVEAKGLSENINAMEEHEFVAFKQELISQRILRINSANKNKAAVIKEVHKFIKSRGLSS